MVWCWLCFCGCCVLTVVVLCLVTGAAGYGGMGGWGVPDGAGASLQHVIVSETADEELELKVGFSSRGETPDPESLQVGTSPSINTGLRFTVSEPWFIWSPSHIQRYSPASSEAPLLLEVWDSLE